MDPPSIKDKVVAALQAFAPFSIRFVPYPYDWQPRAPFARISNVQELSVGT